MKKVVVSIMAIALSFNAFSQKNEEAKLQTTRQYLAKSNLVNPYIETPPGYVGGDAEWTNYQNESTVLGEAIKEAKNRKMPAGNYSVVIKFAVTESGKVSEVKVISKRVGYGLDEAAARFIYESGKWIPGNVEGERTKSYVQMPLSFTIDYTIIM